MVYASGSKFFKFGPATNPTSPNRTKEPIPKPAAQGLKPPKANEANNAESADTTDNSGETKEDVVDADFEEVKENEEKKDAS